MVYNTSVHRKIIMHILFICTGNTCRSPMAEGYFRSLVENEGLSDVQVSSAGTYASNGDAPSPHSVRTLQEYGIDISDQHSTRLTRELVKESDLIIAMTESHRMFVGQLDPSALKKTKLLGEYSPRGDDVADPFGGDADVYSFCFSTMKPSLENLLTEVKKRQ